MLSPSLAFALILLGFALIYWDLVRPGLVLPGVAGLMAVLGGFYGWFAARPAWPGLTLVMVAGLLFVWEAFVGKRFLAGILATLALALGTAIVFSGPDRISPALAISGSCAFGLATVCLADIAKRARRRKRRSAFSGH